MYLWICVVQRWSSGALSRELVQGTEEYEAEKRRAEALGVQTESLQSGEQERERGEPETEGRDQRTLGCSRCADNADSVARKVTVHPQTHFNSHFHQFSRQHPDTEIRKVIQKDHSALLRLSQRSMDCYGCLLFRFVTPQDKYRAWCVKTNATTEISLSGCERWENAGQPQWSAGNTASVSDGTHHYNTLTWPWPFPRKHFGENSRH